MSKLNIVLDIITNHWTSGALARDSRGERLSDPLAPDAVCWCVMGACIKAGMDPSEREEFVKKCSMSPVRANDYLGQKAVINLVKEVINASSCFEAD